MVLKGPSLVLRNDSIFTTLTLVCSLRLSRSINVVCTALRIWHTIVWPGNAQKEYGYARTRPAYCAEFFSLANLCWSGLDLIAPVLCWRSTSVPYPSGGRPYVHSSYTRRRCCHRSCRC